jgi:uncharacterized membrane protein
MGRWAVIAAMGLVLAGMLWLVVRWLWRQRGRQASTNRKALIVGVAALAVVLLALLVGGLQYLWLERRNQAVTVEDLRILERADAFLRDEAAWNRKDDRQCDDDKASGRWSLSCALDVACTEELGHYEHARAALQEVRFVVEEVTHGRQFEGRLMGFNNLPETRFEDVRNVLRIARERVRKRLEESGGAAQQGDEADKR